MMQPKDKIKTIVALSLVSILMIVFFVFGKEAQITKYVSGFCLIAWLAVMVIINRKYN